MERKNEKESLALTADEREEEGGRKKRWSRASNQSCPSSRHRHVHDRGCCVGASARTSIAHHHLFSIHSVATLKNIPSLLVLNDERPTFICFTLHRPRLEPTLTRKTGHGHNIAGEFQFGSLHSLLSLNSIQDSEGTLLRMQCASWRFVLANSTACRKRRVRRERY